MLERIEDRKTWRRLMHDTFLQLDTLYTSELSDAQKYNRKAAILSSLPHRARTVGFHQPERYLLAFSKGTWNNARFIQFRTYNDSRDHFQLLYDKHNGELKAFMDHVRVVTDGRSDPYVAIAEAVGLEAPIR